MIQKVRNNYCRCVATLSALALITLLYNYDVWTTSNTTNRNTNQWSYISTSHLQQIDYKGKKLE